MIREIVAQDEAACLPCPDHEAVPAQLDVPEITSRREERPVRNRKLLVKSEAVGCERAQVEVEVAAVERLVIGPVRILYVEREVNVEQTSEIPLEFQPQDGLVVIVVHPEEIVFHRIELPVEIRVRMEITVDVR